MSAIAYALNELYHTVDKSMLEQAYLVNEKGIKPCAFATLDQNIVDKTLYGRVMGDVHLFGGMQKHLCTAHGRIIQSDGYGVVYHYDDYDLHGHTIMSSTSFFPGISCLDGVHPLAPCALAGSPIQAVFGSTNQAAINNLSRLNSQLLSNQIHGPQAIVTPRVVAHNSIMLDDNSIALAGSTGIFKVIVSNDNALNDLNPRSWSAFSELFNAAVKAYIYQTMRSRIMRGALQYGQEYSIYTDMLQEYVNAEQEYKELRKVWAKVAFMNDKQRYSSFIRIQTQG